MQMEGEINIPPLFLMSLSLSVAGALISFLGGLITIAIFRDKESGLMGGIGSSDSQTLEIQRGAMPMPVLPPDQTFTHAPTPALQTNLETQTEVNEAVEDEEAYLQPERNEVLEKHEQQDQELMQIETNAQPIYSRRLTFSYANILRAVGQVLDQIGIKSIEITEEEDGLFVNGYDGEGQLQVQMRYDIASLYDLVSRSEDQVEEYSSAVEDEGTLSRFLADHREERESFALYSQGDQEYQRTEHSR